jgi:hypothetical protein
MRNYGINYDTGITAEGDSTRKRFEDAVVQRELHIIASDLHATAVRVSGDDPQPAGEGRRAHTCRRAGAVVLASPGQP